MSMAPATVAGSTPVSANAADAAAAANSTDDMPR